MISPLIKIGSLLLIFWLEGIFPLFDRKRRIHHAVPNVAIALINSLMVALCFVSLTLTVIHWTGINQFGLLNQIRDNAPLRGVLGFILFDLWMYFWHMANHRIPFLWRFHRMHHSDTAMDTTTAIRFHTGEILFSSILRIPIIWLLGIQWTELLVYETFLHIVIYFHHSNIGLPEKTDRIFRSLIVTPNMHRVHHSIVIHETNSNYGSVFSFWDRLLSTFRKREDVLNIQYGLPYFREMEWQKLPGMLRTPFMSIKQSSQA